MQYCAGYRHKHGSQLSLWTVCLLVVFTLSSRSALGGPVDDDFFEQQVRPLLVKHCYECHSGPRTSGGLALDTRSGWQTGGETGPAIVPGRPDESLLIQAIRYESLEMPPKNKGGPLSKAEIAALTEWVKAGAPDPRNETARHGGMSLPEAKSWWAFQPLPQVTPNPTPADIDHFLDDQLAAASLTVGGPADRRTLIRRATYDLTGLPPTADDVQAFLNDESHDAFVKVIDRLLASPQYGVKWGRHWLDIVRYADTAGENTDRPLPHAWRYRNWVFDAFHRDMPYDEFVRLQLAGDIMRAEGTAENFREGIVATGYLAIARRFGHDIDKDIHLMFEDVIDNLGRTFLGLSTACARCHDHKYDPLTAEDYYALYGIFNSSKFSFPGCEPKGQPRDLVPLLSPARIEQRMQEWRQRNAAATAEKERRQQLISSVRTHLKTLASSGTLLSAGGVAEGLSVSLADDSRTPLDRIPVGRGEVLQLTVLPNDSHGADSTLVEWEIMEAGGAGRHWKLSDTIPQLLKGNPWKSVDGAEWCFLEVTDGPQFLTEYQAGIDGHEELAAWRLGDTPSVFTNRSDNAIDVWTKLPPRSVFVHPGPNRPVAVAWVSPDDLVVSVSGRVMDAHPSGGDGVAFRLEHFPSSEIGGALAELGRLQNSPDVRVEAPPQIPVAYAVVESTPQDACVHLRGDPEQPGEPVPRRWLSIFGGTRVPDGADSGRLQLGNWIVEHPLSARVIANRIWQWHFGRGLVATSNDFGSRGRAPSHPELLDWLAAQFRRSGYRMKQMHRLIMLTEAYQRSSEVSVTTLDEDPENLLLARFPRRRLDAEEIRDSLLLAAGHLDLAVAEAHPFPPVESWTFTQHNPFAASYETNTRSAYLMVQRQHRDPWLTLFDGPDPNASTPLRQITTVPTQALYFLNAPFFHQQAEAVADRLLSLDSDAERHQHLFWLVLQRSPTASESEQAVRFLKDYPGSPIEKWSAWSRVLLSSNEFLFVD